MTYCDQCGSASIGLDGFCGGCGAHYTNAQLGSMNQASEPKSAKAQTAKNVDPLSEVQFPHMQLAQPGEKNIWIAILLTTFLGPFGLLYCTLSGFIVMLIVSVGLRFFFGFYSSILAWPFCVLWAWYAVKRGSDGWTLW